MAGRGPPAAAPVLLVLLLAPAASALTLDPASPRVGQRVVVEADDEVAFLFLRTGSVEASVGEPAGTHLHGPRLGAAPLHGRGTPPATITATGPSGAGYVAPVESAHGSWWTLVAFPVPGAWSVQAGEVTLPVTVPAGGFPLAAIERGLEDVLVALVAPVVPPPGGTALDLLVARRAGSGPWVSFEGRVEVDAVGLGSREARPAAPGRYLVEDLPTPAGGAVDLRINVTSPEVGRVSASLHLLVASRVPVVAHPSGGYVFREAGRYLATVHDPAGGVDAARLFEVLPASYAATPAFTGRVPLAFNATFLLTNAGEPVTDPGAVRIGFSDPDGGNLTLLPAGTDRRGNVTLGLELPRAGSFRVLLVASDLGLDLAFPVEAGVLESGEDDPGRRTAGAPPPAPWWGAIPLPAGAALAAFALAALLGRARA